MGSWGSEEMALLQLTDWVASFNACVGDYARSGHGMSPGFISPSKYSEDYSLQTIYIHFTGDHFNVVLSQELIHVSSFF